MTITTNPAYNVSRCLEITSQAVYTASEWKYARGILREIFVQNVSDVTFSFYLNATEGFHGKDAFGVLISNIYRTQSMVITTPNGIYEVMHMPFRNNSFDEVVSFHLLEHLEMPLIALREMVRVSKDGVTVVIPAFA